MTPTGTPPAPRSSASAVYDPVRDRIVYFGGYDGTTDGGTSSNEIWELSLASNPPVWTLRTAEGPYPNIRDSQFAAYDAAHDRMLMYGKGSPYDPPDGQVWELRFSPVAAWHVIPSSTPSPSATYHPQMVFDAARDRLLLMGLDVWEFQLGADPHWTLLASPAPPAPADAWRRSPARGALRRKLPMLQDGSAQSLTRSWHASLLRGQLLGWCLLTLLAEGASAAVTRTVQLGDVMISAGSSVLWLDKNGSQVLALGGATGPVGLAFDDVGNLYAVDSQADVIYRWDYAGSALGSYGTPAPSPPPQDLVFDNAGSFCVGSAITPSGSNLAQYNPDGSLARSFGLVDQVDHLDLDCDQCTLYYTTGGRTIKRFNRCQGLPGLQLPDWVAIAHPGNAYGIKILPGAGTALVADGSDIHLVDANGIVTTYDAPGEDDWYCVALDTDSDYFWAGTNPSSGGGHLYKFAIGGSGIPAATYGPFSGPVRGIAVCGGPTAALTHTGALLTAVSLHPVGRPYSQAYGVRGCEEVGDGGAVAPANGIGTAWIWNNSAPGFSIHPSGLGLVDSQARGIGFYPPQNGNQKVGYGFDSAGDIHALLWDVSNAPCDINPVTLPGITLAAAYGTDGTQHVGEGLGSGSQKALLWTSPVNCAGPAATILDPGLSTHGSSALAVSAGLQVGYAYANNSFGSQQACMWSGTAASLTFLSSPGYAGPLALGVSYGRIVGRGYLVSVGTHALVWDALSPGSPPVDLQPTLGPAYQGPGHFSVAEAVDRNRIVGRAKNLVTGSMNAMLWELISGAWQPTDLNNLLPAGYDGSGATGVHDGRIVGTALNLTTGIDEAVEWRSAGACPCAPDNSPLMCGTKFLDANYNGVFDSGESPLAGWTFTLQPGNVSSSPTTANGSYCFSAPAGAYAVSEITRPDWILTKPPTPGSYPSITVPPSVANLDFGNYPCPQGPTCLPAPGGMVVWWPFDEPGPTNSLPVAHDIVGLHHGAWAGGAGPVGGRVGNAIECPTALGFVQVPYTPAFDFGTGTTGSFSIDAWVWLDVLGIRRTIVDKRVLGGTCPVGYRLHITGSNQLALELGSGSFCQTFTGTQLPALGVVGQWYHVAAVVDRPAATATLYVNSCSGGSSQLFAVSSSLGSVKTNGGGLRIGQANFGPQVSFAGRIDEVEIFRRAVSSMDVNNICLAGALGKCKKTCYVPRMLAYGPSQNQLTACFKIVNRDWTQPSMCFHWTLAGLAANTAKCSGTVDGPAVFNPTAGTVCIPAGNTSPPICVNIDHPPGLTPGKVACYQFTVLDDMTGSCFKCNGRLTAGIINFLHPATDLSLVPHDASVTVSFPFESKAPDPSTLRYRLIGVSSNDDPEDLVIGLNGQDPGTPVDDSLVIVGGSSGVINVSVHYTRDLAEPPQEVVLESDADGDGILEELMAIGTVSDTITTTVGVSERLPSDVRPGRVIGLPNPFDRSTSVSFALPTPAQVDVTVYDMTGRKLKVVHSGRLAAGPHDVRWDGTNASGRQVPNGMYFIRVQTGDRVLTAKVVRVN